MQHNSLFILISLSILGCTSSPNMNKVEDVVGFVNLFVGTADDHGQMDPSACVPFGMVKLGPDTEPLGHAGYEFDTDLVRGFSHNRIGGVGCRGAGGNVLIKPGIGELNDLPSQILKPTEQASPGYYSVSFSNGIKAEMTATNQVGYHKYTFPGTDSAYLMINPTSSFDRVKIIDYQVLSISTKEITGYVSAENVCNKGAYTTYFVIKADREFKTIERKHDLLYWSIGDTHNTEINLQVILSPISVDQARRDYQKLFANQDFQKAKQEARAKWKELLGRIQVSGNKEHMSLFYTFLYRSLLTPVNTTSSDDTYQGTDGKTYKVNGHVHYDSWSMWDTFRSKFPLITLAYPELAQDFVRSIEDLYLSGKHDWAGPHEPVPTVRTEHSIVFLLDAYRKGLKVNFDTIYPYLAEEMNRLPYKSPDNWLESSYDKWAMSEIAGILGNKEDEKRYYSESQKYRNAWNQYFKTIDDSADIMHGYGLYEGTIWQYRWHAQFDIPGLTELLGGKESAADQLAYFFDHALYNHGNQPDIHTAYLFNRFGKPQLTKKWVRKILTDEMIQPYGTHKKWSKPYVGRIFNLDPKGYFPEMDDDDGTMSAWYVMSSIGLYPLEIGTENYELTTPIFNNINITPDHRDKIEITVSPMNISSIEWNGQPLRNSRIKHNTLVAGGTLNHDTKEK